MTTSKTLEKLFEMCEEINASDLHLAVGLPPRFRVKGSLVARGEFRAFDSSDVESVALELGRVAVPLEPGEGNERVREVLMREKSIDGAVTSPSGVRYRFNAYRSSDECAVALRRLDSRFRSFAELGIPERIESFSDERDGLFIVTGPTGSGKSTTLATLIDIINHKRDAHIITIEDPIEYIHKSDRCIVHQREVGRDAKGYNDALVEALRQDPDVILVGEVRELDTMRTALRAAETGHLVFTTLHAGDCVGAIERLVAVFPPDEQNSARRQLSLVLRGVAAQHLLPRVEGGRVPACELLVNTLACANHIATGHSAQIYSVMETGGNRGMVTLDQSLERLVCSGAISPLTALGIARFPTELKQRLGRGIGRGGGAVV